MDKSLPSMQWLQTFEATARHASLLRASAELCLTPSALSKQIQALEEQLGVRLFERYNRKLVLTEAGKQYLEGVRQAMATLTQAAGKLRPSAEPNRLHVLVPPYFSASSLLPKLQSFRKRHPDIALSFGSLTPLEFPDLEREQADAAIVLGNGEWPGDHVAEPLLHNYYMVPMCAPALLPQGRPFETVEQMAQLTWLKLRGFPQMWDFWLEQVPSQEQASPNVMWFDSPQEVIEAACQGLGIAMIGAAANMPLPASVATRLALAHTYHRLSGCFSYYLVIPQSRLPSRDIQAFRRWMHELFPHVPARSRLALAA